MEQVTGQKPKKVITFSMDCIVLSMVPVILIRLNCYQ